MPTLSTATVTAAASTQLRNWRRGAAPQVKRNLSLIQKHGGAEAVATLAEVWARTLIASKGFAPVIDPRADQEIVNSANDYLTLIVTDALAARRLIVEHPEPLYVAVVLLTAAA